jgi:hypothetical protein
MNAPAEGVGGALFPRRYVSDRLVRDAGALDERLAAQTRARLLRWWSDLADACGPATGIRALFDLGAMPLFGALGFDASDATFDRAAARVRLATPGGESLALLILPWATRPLGIWRRAAVAARELAATWCFVFAPPYLSLVGLHGSATRRGVDFSFPDVLGPSSFNVFVTLARAEAFERDGSGSRSRVEALVHTAAVFQDRVRSDLQAGVIEALRVLTPAIGGVAVARQPRAFDEALTVLYRVLFLLFAEARDLVPHRHPTYRHAYALGTLWRQGLDARTARGVWDAIGAVTRISRAGCQMEDLIVRPFNGRLFARAAAPALESRRAAGRPTRVSAARDRAMCDALVALATRPTSSGREEISYADLGVEQLGAVYERVLDVTPGALEPGPAARAPEPRSPATRRLPHSRRRKETGTFYTPRDLADLAVRRTLSPLVSGRSADDILALRVVDPAMGSGAFLVAACRYLAAAYEHALVAEGRCAEGDVRPKDRVGMRRLIAERCLAGVDVNPVAVQLARLSLWLATLAEGKPLGFLDHRLRVGDSLIGASPEDVRRARPARTAPASLPLFEDLDLEHSLQRVAQPLLQLTLRPDDTIEDVRAKEAIWSSLVRERSPLAPWRRAADLWCARWFWPARRPNDADPGLPPAPGELRAAVDALVKGDPTLRTPHLARWLSVSARIAAARRFFHWPLEFPDVFHDPSGRPKALAGFDAVIGNPPWEMLRQDARPGDTADRHPRQLVRFIRDSGLYPSCDRGHVNLYQPFLERALSLARPGGRVGLVLPWGLATDDGASALRRRLLERSATDTIVGFDNGQGIFPIHRGVRFLLVTTSPGGRTHDIRARFGLKSRDEIAALSAAGEVEDDAAMASYPVRLSPELLARLGGPGRRIPDIRNPAELEFLDRLSSRFFPLGAEAGWQARFGRELNATEHRSYFGTSGLPVLEGKHVRPFAVETRGAGCRIARRDAARLLPARGFEHARLAYRDVSGVSNRVSLIAAIVPAGAVTSHTLFCLRNRFPLEQQHFLCGLFNSYVLNAMVRLLMGGHLTTSLIEALPVPVWTGTADQRLIARLSARLSTRPESAKAAARLHAAVARLYGLRRAEFGAVLEGFPLISREDRRLALRYIPA